MATELYSEIKKQATLLSADEKKLLARVLNKEPEAESPSSREEQNSTMNGVSLERKREQHLGII